MTSSGWRWAGCLVMLAAALVAPGCSDSDVLSNGNFVVTLETAAVGQGSTGYDCAVMDFNSLQLTALDERAATLLGTSRIVLASQLNEVDFLQSGTCNFFPSVSLSSITLPSGTYEITAFAVSNPTLSTEDPLDLRFCFSQNDPAAFNCTAGCFAEPFRFTVGEGRPNRVRITLDIGALEDEIDADPINCSGFPANFASIISVE